MSCCDQERRQELEWLRQEVGAARGRRERLLPLLQEVQERLGYLPPQAMELLAAGLGMPLAQVYSVATYYRRFTLTPRSQHVLQVCTGTACRLRGADQLLSFLLQRLQPGTRASTSGGAGNNRPHGGSTTCGCGGQPAGEKFPAVAVETVNCFGACGLAPVLAVEGRIHGRMDAGKAAELLEKWVER
ncbi:MAG TPA: NAD(P)H-dependent oxidoreductase subunit E [Firmicutes bacterium]|nr:NAD(P)H-dependent oxidoreductase subunit E [Bacillota bacterium]